MPSLQRGLTKQMRFLIEGEERNVERPPAGREGTSDQLQFFSCAGSFALPAEEASGALAEPLQPSPTTRGSGGGAYCFLPLAPVRIWVQIHGMTPQGQLTVSSRGPPHTNSSSGHCSATGVSVRHEPRNWKRLLPLPVTHAYFKAPIPTSRCKPAPRNAEMSRASPILVKLVPTGRQLLPKRQCPRSKATPAPSCHPSFPLQPFLRD
jgi:hypothetical protein